MATPPGHASGGHLGQPLGQGRIAGRRSAAGAIGYYAPAHHIPRPRAPGAGDRTGIRVLPSGVARVAPSRLVRRHLGGGPAARGTRPHRRGACRAHRLRRVAGGALRRERRVPSHPLVPRGAPAHATRRSRHHLPGHRRHLHRRGGPHRARVGPGPRAVPRVVRGRHRRHRAAGVVGRAQVGHRRALHRGGMVGAGHHPAALRGLGGGGFALDPGRRRLLHDRGGVLRA